jgi:diguanylate cyclase (GGDEF)-like protein
MSAMIIRKLEQQLAKLREENERLRRELEFDPLTGLLSARALKERLEDCVEEAFESGAEPALLFIDVDRFKQVNEDHGHNAAGRVLSQIGRVIARCIRADDLAFRYAGDEFVVLVSGGEAGAKLVGERIRRAIERHAFPVQGLQGRRIVKVTVSLGLRVVREGDTAAQVLAEADRAMFEAKRRSRNTLVSAEVAA